MSWFNRLSTGLSLGFLALMLFMAIFADFIANDRPILAMTHQGSMKFFERLESEDNYAWTVYAPVRYKGGLDLRNTTRAPFEQAAHILGTDHLGRDVLAGLIHGGRTSLGISLVAIITAALLGVILGGGAGFMGDSGVKLSWPFMAALVVVLILAHFFLVALEGKWLLLLISVVLVAAVYHFSRKRAAAWSGAVRFPLDFWVLKFMELFSSIPSYFLILALVAFVEPNWFLFAFIIGATSWVGIARLTRGEMMRVRSSGYIESARALGLSPERIFFKHALPNAVGPLPYAITFGIAAIIVVESTLSYFGIGLPADSLSWGNALSGFKNNPSNWWVALFPGLVIFLTILSLHQVGRWLDHRYNPRRSSTYQIG